MNIKYTTTMRNFCLTGNCFQKRVIRLFIYITTYVHILYNDFKKTKWKIEIQIILLRYSNNKKDRECQNNFKK